jgi:hypothetical protein
MTDSYKIITDKLKIDDVISQLRAIKTYPAMISIYDRVMKVSTSDECHMLCHGIEIGSYVAEDNVR